MNGSDKQIEWARAVLADAGGVENVANVFDDTVTAVPASTDRPRRGLSAARRDEIISTLQQAANSFRNDSVSADRIIECRGRILSITNYPDLNSWRDVLQTAEFILGK